MVFTETILMFFSQQLAALLIKSLSCKPHTQQPQFTNAFSFTIERASYAFRKTKRRRTAFVMRIILYKKVFHLFILNTISVIISLNMSTYVAIEKK